MSCSKNEFPFWWPDWFKNNSKDSNRFLGNNLDNNVPPQGRTQSYFNKITPLKKKIYSFISNYVFAC